MADSPYLTVADAARYLRYPATKRGRDSFREWATRHRIPRCQVGGRILYHRDDLDALVQQSRAPRKRVVQMLKAAAAKQPNVVNLLGPCSVCGKPLDAHFDSRNRFVSCGTAPAMRGRR